MSKDRRTHPFYRLFLSLIGYHRSVRHPFSRIALAILTYICALSIYISTDVTSNPQGGRVVAGNANIQQSPNSTVINQSSQKAIINWQSFNIAKHEGTHFQQPVGGITLNRINPSQGVSQIYGVLTATGKIILINSAGIYFGPSAYVNVGGLIASTANITDQNFLNNIYRFAQEGNYAGSVINEGQIIATQHGLVALIGNSVSNTGLIKANLGQIVLASGNAFTMTFAGNEMIGFSVDESALSPGVDINGKPLRYGVSNTGKLIANGGSILMTADAAQAVLNNAINMKGIAVANSVGINNGEIILNAGPGGAVHVSGKLIASGKQNGQQGGTVKILGNQVALTHNAVVDVSGNAGGGTVLIGGNEHGAGPEQNADYTFVGKGVNIYANGLVVGDGGVVIVWSNKATRFYGNIFAQGGSQSGNGGFVETSGKNYLEAMGSVNASAVNGEPGIWLLDPANVTISTATTANGTFSGGNPNTFTTTANDAIANVNTIITSLNGGTSVTILTTPSGTQNGDITVNSSISKTAGGNATLTLTASSTGTININQPISSTTGNLSVVLNGANAININAGITTLNGAFTATTVGSTGSILQTAGTISTGTGARTFTVPTTSSGSIGTSSAPISTTGTGTMTLTVGSGGAFINNTGNFTLATPTLNANSPLTIKSSGTLTLPNFAFSTGTGSLDFESTGGTLSTANTLTTTSGNISLVAGTGLLTLANNITTGSGTVSLTGVGITQSNSIVVNAGTGNITANAGTGTLTMGTNSRLLTGNATGSVGAINISANGIALNTSGTPSQIGGTGAAAGLANLVTIQPSTAGTTIGIAGGTGTLSLTAAETNDIRATNVTLGNSSAGLMTLAAWTPGANFAKSGLLTLQTGSGGITQTGALNLATSLSALTATTTGLLSSNAITATNQPVSLTGVGITQAGATSINTGTGNITMNAGTGTLTLNATSLLLSGNASGTAGTINLIGDLMSFNASSQVGGTGTGAGSAYSVIFQPSTSGRTIGVAGGTGNLALPAATLNLARSANVRIGNSNAGAITIGTSGTTWSPASTFATSLLTLDTGSSISQTATSSMNLGTRGLLLRDANSVSLANTGNTFSNIAANISGSLSILNSAANALTVASLIDDIGTVSGITAPNGVTLNTTNASSSLVLNAPITANKSGNDIVLAGPLFTNNVGALALNPGIGNFLVWSGNPASDNRGGLAYNFKQYNAIYGSTTVLGTGNGFLYSIAPIITPSLTGTVVKSYTGTTVATLAPSNYTFTGAIDSDVVTLNNPASGTYSSPNVGNNLNVSVSGISIASATSGSATVYGYQITPTANANIGQITPASLNITANNAAKTYGQTVTFTGHEFTPTGLQNGETVGSVTLNSTGAGPTANVPGSPYSILASNATGGTFNPANYSISYTNGALTVNPAALSIAANNATKTYGQTVTFTGNEFTPTGLQNGETVGSVTLNSTGAGPTANVPGSPYSILASNATGGTFNPANYSISYTNGALTVNPAALSIAANNAIKTYGQTVTFTGHEFTSTGLQNGETVGSVTLNSTGAGPTANVPGSPYSILASNATGGTFNPANYSISYTNGALTVNPAALSIAANSATKTYGQTVTFTGNEFTSTGLQNGETVGSVTLNSTGAGPTANVPGSPYSILASNATGGTFNPANYSISYTNGALTVNPAALSIAANSATKTYGQTVTFTGNEFTSTGLQNGETVGSVTLNSTGAGPTANVPGSPYSILASNATGGTFNPANYSISYTNGALTVNPAALSIAANSATKTYGQTVTFTGNEFTPTGLQNGETVGSVTLNSAGAGPTANVPGSPYSILASNATGGTFNPANYSISYTNGALTVNPAALSIAANSATKTYGQTVTFTGNEFTSTGLQNGETVGSVTLNSTGAGPTANVPGSPYSILASNATGGTFNPANYSISYTNGALTVNPAALSIAANSATKTYGQTVTFTGNEFTSTGLQNGETVGSVTLNSTGAGPTANVPGSPYSILASNATGGTFNPANYSISYTNGALTVNPATLTYIANSASRKYGIANPELSGTVSGFVNGETQTTATTGLMTFITPATLSSKAGNYAIRGSGLTANYGNYIFVQAPGNASAFKIYATPVPIPAAISKALVASVISQVPGKNAMLNIINKVPSSVSITVTEAPKGTQGNISIEHPISTAKTYGKIENPVFNAVMREMKEKVAEAQKLGSILPEFRNLSPREMNVEFAQMPSNLLEENQAKQTLLWDINFIIISMGSLGILAIASTLGIVAILYSMQANAIQTLANRLTKISEDNYFNKTKHLGNYLAVSNANDIVKLLPDGLPNGYEIIPTPIPNNANVVCILKGPMSTRALFTVRGVAVTSKPSTKSAIVGAF